jgi:23S rRNA (uracil1939-C5)-methyltransferase
VGIEVVRESAECFDDNVNRNERDNVTVVQGPVERVFGLALEDYGSAVNSVLVDPPREGLKKDVIDLLNRASFRKLVYVSCDPGTLARDLKLLTPTYSILKITPLDMFPQTKHLEAVAVLERTHLS